MGLCQQYAALWPADQQDTAQAVCMGESSGDADPPNSPACCKGLWQINCDAHPDFDCSRAADPAYNAQYAFQLWQQQGWTPWQAYTNGSYAKYLTGSAPASNPVQTVQATVQSALASSSSLVPILIGGLALIVGLPILEDAL